jgi:hypothetical protein
VLPGQGAGEELQFGLGVAQFLSDLEKFQGAAAEPLHLVHHEGHPRPQRAVLAGRRQGRLHFGAFADPGADLFLEKPVYAGGFEGIDLGLDLLRPAGDSLGSFQKCVSPVKRKETACETNRPAAMLLAPGVETGTSYETPTCGGAEARQGLFR